MKQEKVVKFCPQMSELSIAEECGPRPKIFVASGCRPFQKKPASLFFIKPSENISAVFNMLSKVY